MHINKRKSDAFNFNLDEEEQELSDALDALSKKPLIKVWLMKHLLLTSYINMPQGILKKINELIN